MDTPQIQLDETEILADQSDSPVEAEATGSESSTEEANAEATTEAEEPAEGEETQDEDESEGDAEASDDEAESTETDTDQPKKGAEARKEQLNTEIRDLVAKRNAIREEVALKNAQAYQPASAEALMDQGMDEATARVTALEQRTQMAEFNARVADVTASVNTEALQVMKDFPIFDEQSTEYNPELSQLAESVYMQSAGIKTDPQTGLMYDVAVMPYQVYSAIAKAHSSGANTGQVKAQRSAEKMLANVETPTSVAPKQPKEDPFLAGLRRGL